MFVATNTSDRLIVTDSDAKNAMNRNTVGTILGFPRIDFPGNLGVII